MFTAFTMSNYICMLATHLKTLQTFQKVRFFTQMQYSLTVWNTPLDGDSSRNNNTRTHMQLLTQSGLQVCGYGLWINIWLQKDFGPSVSIYFDIWVQI